MTTVANIQATPKEPTKAISRLAKDFGFEIRFCKVRTQAKEQEKDQFMKVDGKELPFR